MIENKETPSDQAGSLYRRATRFIAEVRVELSRVTWPTRREVWATTVVVILTSMLFETSPYDPITLATITIVLGAIAVLACLLPAYRATRINPIDALRAE